MATANDLILTNPAAEEQHDAVLSALSTLAYEEKPKKRKKSMKMSSDLIELGEPVYSKETRKFHFKSRFFMRPVSDEVAERKEKFKKKELSHIDHAVKDRVKTYRVELSSTLQTSISEVRDFFLTTIGQKTYAAEAGSIQAQQVVQELIGSQADPRIFSNHERMLEIGVNLLMAQKVAKFLGLPKSAVAEILTEFYPKQSQKVSVAIPSTPNTPAGSSAPSYVPRHIRNQQARNVEPKRVSEPKNQDKQGKRALKEWDY